MKLQNLVVLSLVVALALSGCDMLNPEEELPIVSDPVVITSENELVSFTRTTLPEVRRGAGFKVIVEMVAKTELELAAISEEIPESFRVLAGDTTVFLADVQPGDKLELNYTLKAGDLKGIFDIKGFSRAKPQDQESLQLELVSPITVR